MVRRGDRTVTEKAMTRAMNAGPRPAMIHGNDGFVGMSR
jgi:hypothetical protein